jgi:hypothetical protein
MRKFVDFYYLLEQRRGQPLKIHTRITRIPSDKPYGFWMDRHGNFAVVNGGMGEHEFVGQQILDDLGVPAKRGVYDTLFSLGWIRIVLVRGMTYYEAGIGQRLVPIQKRNLSFINDLYDLGGIEEG